MFAFPVFPCPLAAGLSRPAPYFWGLPMVVAANVPSACDTVHAGGSCRSPCGTVLCAGSLLCVCEAGPLGAAHTCVHTAAVSSWGLCFPGCRRGPRQTLPCWPGGCEAWLGIVLVCMLVPHSALLSLLDRDPYAPWAAAPSCESLPAAWPVPYQPLLFFFLSFPPS